MQEMQETQIQSLGREGPLEQGMATHTSIHAWRIPCTREPDRLHFMEIQRAGHDWSDLVQTPQLFSLRCRLYSFLSMDFILLEYF